MGLLDRFMKGPDESREPEMRDREMILAYFEEMARTRQTLTMTQKDDDLVPHQVTVQLFNDARRELTLGLRRALSEDLAAKTPLTLVFTLDGHRLKAQVKYLSRGGYLQIVVTLPEKVQFAERRSKLRAKFGAREKATVTVLQGLFEGIGVAGKLVNLSLEGLCLQVDRAIQVAGDKRIKIDEHLLPAGTKLMLVRLLDLPQLPTLECSGTACWLRQGAEGMLMGVQLWGLGAQEMAYLEQVMTRRLPTFSSGFPQRHRRTADGAEPQERPRPEAEREEDPEQEQTGDLEGSAEPAPLQGEVLDMPFEEDAATFKAATGRDRLLQFRRRSKHILVVMADDLDRAILAGTLQVDGYVNIHEARSLVQALDRVKKHLPDVVVVDHQVGPHLATDVVLKLRSLGNMDLSPVVVLQDKSDVKLTLGAKALRLKHIFQKPVDYDGFLKPLLDRLLDLQ